MGHGINRQRHIALHMHGDIALNGCECMINESTLHWYLIWGGGGGGGARFNGTTSNRVARFYT